MIGFASHGNAPLGSAGSRLGFRATGAFLAHTIPIAERIGQDGRASNGAGLVPRSPRFEERALLGRQTWTDKIRKPPNVIAPPVAEVPTGEAKSPEERKAILASRVAYYVGAGYRPESRTDYQATLVRGRRPNHVLHLILSIHGGFI